MKKIVVIGQGFVGFPMSIVLSECLNNNKRKTFNVIGLEANNIKGREIVNKINNKILPIITNARSHDIDMNTIDSSIDFYKQIQHTCEFLKIDQIHYNMIETLRMVWLKSVPVIKKDAETKFNLDRFYAATKLKDNT